MADGSDDDSFESAGEDEPTPPASLMDKPETKQQIAKDESPSLPAPKENISIPNVRDLKLSPSPSDPKPPKEDISAAMTDKQMDSIFSDSAATEKKEPIPDSGSGWAAWGSWGASLLSELSSASMSESPSHCVPPVPGDSVSQLSSEESLGLNVEGNDIVTRQPGPDALTAVGDDVHPSASDSTCPADEPTQSHPFDSLASLTSGFDSLTSGFLASAGAGFSSLGSLASANVALPSFADLASPLTSPKDALPALSSAGFGLMEGGLSVLEKVGRKTMDLLKETDPGLSTTRAIFEDRKGKPTLSILLREGRELRETQTANTDKLLDEQKTKFKYWFDELQGLAHLEALEMLSSRCETEIEDFLGPNPDESIKSDLMTIKAMFLQEDDEEMEDTSIASLTNQVLVQILEKHVLKLGIPVATEKFIQAREQAREAVLSFDESFKTGSDEKDVQSASQARSESAVASASAIPSTQHLHQKSMQCLADLVARSIEHFHKTGQMALMPKKLFGGGKDDKAIDIFMERMSHLCVIVKILAAEVDVVAGSFGQCLTKLEGAESELVVNQVITDIFLESSQGVSYIKSAFNLLLPVMQTTFLAEQGLIRDVI